MGSLKVIFSHPILSLSVNEFLQSLMGGRLDIVGNNDKNKFDAVDVVLTDFATLKNSDICLNFPRAKIILIDTGLNSQQKRIAVSYYKVRGIISNKISIDVFEKALDSIRTGNFWLDHHTSQELVMFYGNKTAHKKIKTLTRREQQIIPLVCKGLNNKEIAQKMGISIPTVKALLTKVFRKLDVGSRYELFVNAYESGILEQLKNDL